VNRLTHIAGGAAAWLGPCAVIHPAPATIAGGAVIAGVCAPWCDIDNLGAWAKRTKRGLRRRRRAGKTIWQLNLIRWRAHPIRGRLSALIALAGPHRQGPCHSLLTALCAGAGLAWAPALWWAGWPAWAGAALAAGLCSHILLDLANEKPVRALWPLRLELYGLGIPVGKRAEVLLIRPAVTFAAALFAVVAIRGH
jgi:hypothetical protein